jgi:hypothetical protein
MTQSAPAEYDPPVATPSRKIETLEDLYAAFPDFGDGIHYIRIERTKPMILLGRTIGGRLEESFDPIPLDEVQRRYGGKEFEISMFGPVKGRLQEDGTPQVRRLAAVRVKLPGEPKGAGVPTRPNEAPMVRGEGSAAEDRERRDYGTLRRQTENALAAAPEIVQRGAEQHAQSLREEISALRKQMSLKEAEAVELRDDLVEERRKQIESESKTRNEMMQQHHAATEAARAASEREKAILKEGWDKERSTLTDAWNRERESMRERIDQAVREANARSEGEMSRIRNDLSSVVARYESQIGDLSRRHNDERAELRQQIDAERNKAREEGRERITDIDRQHQRDLMQLKEHHAAQLEQTRLVATSDEKANERMHKMEVNTLTERLTRAEAESKELRDEVDELRAEQNKDPATFLQETETAARTYLKMVPASEAAGSEEDKADWKKMLARGVMGALEKAPELAERIADRVMDVRQQNMQQQQMQQQSPQAQAQRRVAARVRNQAPPAPWELPGLPVAPGTMQGAPEPFGPPVVVGPSFASAPVQPIQYGITGVVPASPSPSASPPPAQPVQPLSYAPPPPPQPQAQAAAAPPPQAPPPIAITQEQVVGFIDQLEAAIRDGVVTPAMFARGFVEQATPQTAREIVARVTPDELFAKLDSMAEGKQTAIMTRDGRAYVRAVWAEVIRLLGG